MNPTLLVFTLLAAPAAGADAGTLFVQSAWVIRDDGGPSSFGLFFRLSAEDGKK